MENGSKTYEVIITDAAWEQMIGHARFLANISLETADRLVDDFVKSADTLTQII
jgi:hypothetical protein